MMSTYLRYSPLTDIKNHDHPTAICYLMESLLKFQFKLHLLFMSQVESMYTMSSPYSARGLVASI